MSGLKPIEMNYFYARLHERGMDTTKLAALTGRSRSAVTRVLNGARRRGPIWAKICVHLMAEEIALLDVAHRHPWNEKRLKNRPVFDAEKARFFEERKLALDEVGGSA